MLIVFRVGSFIPIPGSNSDVLTELGQITGQKPLVTKAKKSIAGFKLREGMPIGAKVTLRGERMYIHLRRHGRAQVR